MFIMLMGIRGVGFDPSQLGHRPRAHANGQDMLKGLHMPLQAMVRPVSVPLMPAAPGLPFVGAPGRTALCGRSRGNMHAPVQYRESLSSCRIVCMWLPAMLRLSATPRLNLKAHPHSQLCCHLCLLASTLHEQLVFGPTLLCSASISRAASCQVRLLLMSRSFLLV